MFYILSVIILFIASVAVHILFCRQTTQPGLHAKAFIIIAIIFLVIYTLLVFALRSMGLLDPHSLWGLPFRISSGVIFILLIPVYLCFYVLTQLTSPSQKILLTISQRGEVSYADILASLEEENFIMTRLNDLCASGCVEQVGGRYILSREGQSIALFLNLMQGALGRKVGG